MYFLLEKGHFQPAMFHWWRGKFQSLPDHNACIITCQTLRSCTNTTNGSLWKEPPAQQNPIPPWSNIAKPNFDEVTRSAHVRLLAHILRLNSTCCQFGCPLTRIGKRTVSHELHREVWNTETKEVSRQAKAVRLSDSIQKYFTLNTEYWNN